MKRRLLLIFAVFLTGAVLGLATMPWWLGGALRAASRSLGLHFATYERLGYSRFVLTDLDLVRGNTRIRLDRLEADTPMPWLIRQLTGRPPQLRGGRWRVDVTKSSRPASTEPSMGLNELHALLEQIAFQLNRWSTTIDLGQGVVTWPGAELDLNKVSWHARQLVVDELSYKMTRGKVEIGLPASGPISVDVVVVGNPLHVHAVWSENSVQGELTFAEQVASLQGTFAAHHWLPERARLAADDWHLTGSRLAIGERYREIHGKAVIEWQSSGFTVETSAQGDPQNASTPALHAAAHAHGDLERISIDAFEISGPGLRGVMTAPVVFDHSGKLESGPSRFEVSVDLKELGVPEVQGKIEGEISLTPTQTGWSRATYRLTVAGALARGFSLPKFEMTGQSNGPQIDLAHARVDFGSDDWVELKGGVNLQKGELTASHVEGRLHHPLVARWLPSKVTFGLATFEADLAGAYTALEHHGKAQISEASAPRVHPLNLSLAWKGRGPTLPSFTLEAEAGAGLLRGEGSLDGKSVTIKSLQVWREKNALLRSDQPWTLSWSPALRLDSFLLAAPAGSLELSGEIGANGAIHLAGKNVQSDWAKDFFVLPETSLTLETIALDGRWKDGPMDFTLRGQLTLPLVAKGAARADFSMQGDAKGLRLEKLDVLQGTFSSVTASGQLPVTINPAHAPFFKLDPAAALELHASTRPDGPFWEELTKLTGVTVEDPRVDADVKGTWDRPTGTLEVHARALRPEAKRWPQIPEITELNLRLSGDRDAVVAEEANVKIDGQAVNASGRFPTGTSVWQEIAANPRSFDWRKASARIEVPDADLGVLAKRAHTYLAAKGLFQADLTLAPGGLVSGNVRIKDAASRPISGLGVIQDIQAEVSFTGKKAELKNVEARIGGQPVVMLGSAELASDGTPQFDLVVRGQNLSVVRQAGLLVRTDLDLKIKTGEHEVTKIGGTVRLRDSLFMSDIRAFIPGGERSAGRRPPYFSVDTPPMNKWELDVNVTGEKFMKVRTAIFNGTATANFHLEGTLGEPRAIGEVAIDEGQVLFPFANFSIDHGSIRLLQENPFEPQLSINGSVRRYDYDLQMEVTGTASDPKLIFSSNPPLDSQQLLLMVTTGTVPRSDYAQSDRQRITQIGTYLGQSLFENIGGESPGGDRLDITTGEGLSDALKETYTVEYRLNGRWSLIGEYDEFDDYNVGFKWRVLRGEAGHGK